MHKNTVMILVSAALIIGLLIWAAYLAYTMLM